MNELSQPILSDQPHPDHHVLSLVEFLSLLREEEDYYKGEQNNTRLMITRLRKIFYDKEGWNAHLIRKAAGIENRYHVFTSETPGDDDICQPGINMFRRYKNNKPASTFHRVVYKANDQVYGNTREGKTPEIFKCHHQEVKLANGYISDIGHVLVGLDALNHPQVVSPLPDWLAFFHKCFPYVKSNVDAGTWLGDIASSAEDFLWGYFDKKRPLTIEEEQEIINSSASGADLLGNIDAYIIGHLYKIGASSGLRVTSILEDYYNGGDGAVASVTNRFQKFCELIGLKNFDGKIFENEKVWIAAYKKQLRNTTAFTTFSNTEETLKGILIPIRIWRNKYGEVLKLETLLQIFLTALKKQMLS